jgi:hypothetical protein
MQCREAALVSTSGNRQIMQSIRVAGCGRIEPVADPADAFGGV